MTLRRPLFLLAATLLAVAPPALGHDDATLDTMRAPNGGQLRMAGAYHYELVIDPKATAARPAPLLVFVTDHAGTKTPVAGASGSAIILAGGAKATIALKPDGDNRMKGQGAYVAAPDMKVLVSITLPGQAAAQARFTPRVTAANAGGSGRK